MSAEINQLYDPVIKSHNANPFHFQKITGSTFSFKAYNLLCGDKFDFYLECERNRISSLHFYGFGCAVSKAAGSLLIKTVEGRTIEESITFCGEFLKLLKGDSVDGNLPNEFNSFAVVKDFPARYDCAAMACEEMLKFLKKFES